MNGVVFAVPACTNALSKIVACISDKGIVSN